MPVTDALYREIALADPEGKWELVGGRLRSKPTMSSRHNSRSYRLSIAAWRRQESGEYVRTLHREGIVTIPSLPGVTINMAELFR